jgi:predicted TIM-barrel fold metal-dependent hydrolase
MVERLIDACAFHEWGPAATLMPYMSDGWRHAIRREGDYGGPMATTVRPIYQRPLGSKLESARPESGPPGSDVDLLIRQLLDEGGRERVVLGYDDGILATPFPLPYVSRAVTSAANDWTIEKWLERDDRLFGHVLIPSTMPDEAAAEIRRVGTHPQMVAVALGTNGLGRPFGHPCYHAVYEAASEVGLPLVIQIGSDTASELAATPFPMGLAATYGETDAMASVPMMMHSMSLIMGGVFDLWPDLEVLLVGAGAAWIPTFLWRCDYQFQLMPGVEAPWMDVPPSSYFVNHFKIATYGLEAPANTAQLHAFLRAIPNIDGMLMHASCYPNIDSEEPAAIAERIPKEWHQRVFHDNAMAFYGWSDRPTRERRVALTDLRERAGAAR